VLRVERTLLFSYLQSRIPLMVFRIKVLKERHNFQGAGDPIFGWKLFSIFFKIQFAFLLKFMING